MGTRAYMPPEQARGQLERVDERSDVFALGAILCEILTGRPPCAGDAPAVHGSRTEAALEDARARLDAVADEPELVELCKRCLSEEREDRPRGANEVAQAIGAYRASIEERARAAQIAVAEARVKMEEERKARWLTLGLASSAVLTLLIGGGGWLWHQRQHERRRAQTAELVNPALEHASLLYGQVSASNDPARWQEALAAVDRVRALLDAGEPSAGLEQRAGQLAEQIRAGAATAEQRTQLAASNHGLLARLQELRVPEGEGVDAPDWSQVDAAFDAAFRAHGLDVDGQAEDVAREIRERGLGVDVALSLDQWAAARRRAGKAQDAERLTSVALAADLDAARASVRQALAHGDRAELVRLTRSAALESLPVATLTLLGNSLTAAGAEEEALRVLHVAQQLRPDDFVSNVYLARLFWDRDYQESARYYSAALAVKPDDAIVVHEFGYLLEHFLLEPARAVALYRRALERLPDDATLHFYLGLALLSLGSCDEAIASIQTTLRLEPRRAGAYVGLMKCHWVKGDLDGVLAVSRETLRVFPGHSGALEHLGLTMLRMGDLDAAAETLQEAARLVPGNLAVHEGLRRVFEARGDHARALQAAHEVVRAPDFLLDYFDRGMSLREFVDVDQAIRERREAVRAFPASAAQHGILGVLLQEKGLYAESLFELQVASALGADKSTWTLPSENQLGNAMRLIYFEPRCDQWIEEARRLAELESRFERILHGEDAARDAAEQADLARLALRRERTATAARMFAECLSDSHATGVADARSTARQDELLTGHRNASSTVLPDIRSTESHDARSNRAQDAHSTGLQDTHSTEVQDVRSTQLPDWCRREAAAAAAMAGCGRGGDVAALSSSECAELRDQAAQWVRADLALRAREISSGDPASRLRAARALATLALDSRLGGVRDADALAALAPEERTVWRELWSEVETLEGRIRLASASRTK